MALLPVLWDEKTWRIERHSSASGSKALNF
jgi:hypothetical protein